MTTGNIIKNSQNKDNIGVVMSVDLKEPHPMVLLKAYNANMLRLTDNIVLSSHL